MAKLTEAQRRVLERMAGGDEAWTIGGLRNTAFWHNDLAARAPSTATLHALHRSGLIENRKTEKYGGAEYAITDAGRAALAAPSASAQGGDL